MCEYCEINENGANWEVVKPLIEEKIKVNCEYPFSVKGEDAEINGAALVNMKLWFCLAVEDYGDGSFLAAEVNDQEYEKPCVNYLKRLSINYCPMCGRKLGK